MNQNLSDLVSMFDKESPLYDSETDTFHHQIAEYIVYSNLSSELNGNKDLFILDSGGGTGKYSVLLGRQGFNVELIDISPKSVSLAQKKFSENKLIINAAVANSENPPFLDNTFDFVMLNGAVISYTPNPLKLLRETQRILKPGGRIWFDFFNNLGWAIEIKDPVLDNLILSSDNYLIQMPDWEYPARLMSISYVESLLKEVGFKLKSKYGLINVSHSFSLDFRYSKEYSIDLVDKYRNIELELSNHQDCIGSAWSCIFCANKV